MIKVGINENVFIQGLVLDEKGSLEIKFGEADAPQVKSGFAAIQDDEVVENTSMSVRIFPPQSPKEPNELTLEKKADRAQGDINKTKGILLHLMAGYMTSDVMPSLGKIAFAGIDITEDNYSTEIIRKEIMELVHKNMCKAFVEAMQPYLNKPELKFRLLLVRQSADKHFATFRGRFIKDNPFYESMDIPSTGSKVKFTAYEIKEGLNNGDPIAKPAAGTTADKAASEAAPVTTESLFGPQS